MGVNDGVKRALLEERRSLVVLQQEKARLEIEVLQERAEEIRLSQRLLQWRLAQSENESVLLSQAIGEKAAAAAAHKAAERLSLSMASEVDEKFLEREEWRAERRRSAERLREAVMRETKEGVSDAS